MCSKLAPASHAISVRVLTVFSLAQKMRVLLFALFAAIAFASSPEGEKFLEEYSKKDGVVTLPSGLRYRVIKSGEGKTHPKVNTPCECHYRGESFW